MVRPRLHLTSPHRDLLDLTGLRRDPPVPDRPPPGPPVPDQPPPDPPVPDQPLPLPQRVNRRGMSVAAMAMEAAAACDAHFADHRAAPAQATPPTPPSNKPLPQWVNRRRAARTDPPQPPPQPPPPPPPPPPPCPPPQPPPASTPIVIISLDFPNTNSPLNLTNLPQKSRR